MGIEQRNLVGNKYGKLYVVKMLGKYKPGNPHYYSLVRCDCGKEFPIQDSCLVSGRQKNCAKCGSKKFKKRHGMTGTPIHNLWLSMRQRCSNPNDTDYRLYGGRGIKVCDEWNKSFETFAEWALSSGYQVGLSIDRIDVNGNYEPDNCRFITMFEQASNKRNNVFIQYEGETVTVTEASRRCGIPQSTLANRIRAGWNDYDATHIPVYKGHAAKVLNTITNEFRLFDSLKDASQFVGKQKGYLSNKSKKIKRKEFSVGDYYVEIAK